MTPLAIERVVRSRSTEGVHTQTQPAPRSNGSSGDRYAEIIARYLGPTLTELFQDDDVTEIYINPQECVVRVDTRSRGKITTAERMSAHRIEMLLNAVAASIGENLTPENPRLQATTSPAHQTPRPATESRRTDRSDSSDAGAHHPPTRLRMCDIPRRRRPAYPDRFP